MYYTSYEEHLHGNVAAYSAVADQGGIVAAFSVTDKADIIRHSHGHVKGGQQNQPVPHSLADAVVQQDERWLPHRSHLVLGQGRFLKHTLKDTTTFGVGGTQKKSWLTDLSLNLYAPWILWQNETKFYVTLKPFLWCNDISRKDWMHTVSLFMIRRYHSGLNGSGSVCSQDEKSFKFIKWNHFKDHFKVHLTSKLCLKGETVLLHSPWLASSGPSSWTCCSRGAE